MWLGWLVRRRPRNLDHFMDSHGTTLLAAMPELRWHSVEGYTQEKQRLIWDQWVRSVTVKIRVCAAATLPLETSHNCLTDPAEFATSQSSGEWLVDATATESIMASGQRLIPEYCPRNNYTLEFVFSAVPDARQDVVVAAMSALADSDASIRVLAAGALGAMGPGAGAAVEALKGHLRDKVPEVCAAVKDALLRIEQ